MKVKNLEAHTSPTSPPCDICSDSDLCKTECGHFKKYVKQDPSWKKHKTIHGYIERAR